MVDKHMMELKNYQLVCHFCGVHLENSTVNSTCLKNCSDNQSKEKLTNSQSIPNDLINSNRHYFAQPIKDFPEKYLIIKIGSLTSRT